MSQCTHNNTFLVEKARDSKGHYEKRRCYECGMDLPRIDLPDCPTHTFGPIHRLRTGDDVLFHERTCGICLHNERLLIDLEGNPLLLGHKEDKKTPIFASWQPANPEPSGPKPGEVLSAKMGGE